MTARTPSTLILADSWENKNAHSDAMGKLMTELSGDKGRSVHTDVWSIRGLRSHPWEEVFLKLKMQERMYVT